MFTAILRALFAPAPARSARTPNTAAARPSPGNRAGTAGTGPKPAARAKGPGPAPARKAPAAARAGSPARPRPAAAAPRAQGAAPIHCPDMLALVVFDEEARLVSPFRGAFDAGFAKSVQALPGEVRGSITNMAAGLAMANALIAEQPRGLLRRIWLLSDGWPNPPRQPIDAAVERAVAQKTNINTVGIGEPGGYDRALLERIAGRTHNGRFMAADSAEKLHAVFGGAARPRKPGSHRGEATVFVVDVSGSMSTPMGRARRIEAVRDAMNGLLKYKQARWA